MDAAGRIFTRDNFLQAYRLQESCWKKLDTRGYNKKK